MAIRGRTIRGKRVSICYYALLDAIESLPTAASRRRQFRAFLDCMLARGELVYGAALAAASRRTRATTIMHPTCTGLSRRRSGCAGGTAAEYDALAATARRVLEQLDKHAAVCLDGQEGRLRYRLTDACQTMFLRAARVAAQGTCARRAAPCACLA